MVIKGIYWRIVKNMLMLEYNVDKITPPKRKRFASPYSGWETIKWLWRNVRVKKSNPGDISFLPKSTRLNLIDPKYRLSFIGDIMDLGHKYLEISPALKDFIKNSDFLVGNLEATITNAKPRGVDQVHDEKVIEGLIKIFPPSKTLLSLANNHSGDFGEEIFLESMKKLKNAGFKVFGENKTPTYDLTSDLQFITASMWTNRKCGFITYLGDLTSEVAKDGAMNIFYPHWGYDLELYPRKSLIMEAEKYLREFDAIVGHHSHVPQPITSVSYNGLNKLLAYSLGDFCFGKILPKYLYNYNYGLILNTEVGKTTDGQWEIGKVEWSFTECIRKDPKTMLVELKGTNPYYPDIE